ncbi:hypothetical protein DdX_04449 [Ditylenchus destructor]|uniref:Uncharacterized protein n=1 Tax=Ditylenchus destructor TaxID=166010 RepID=A0AAD4N8A6_9BILA|nr:hypothetical protein DdX_04449 [Ditylenchus destructor]
MNQSSPFIPFGIFYDTLSFFERQELCLLCIVNRRQKNVIERKFATVPYLLFSRLLYMEESCVWAPKAFNHIKTMPEDMISQLKKAAFVRFKSTEFDFNVRLSPLDILAMNHLWENNDLCISYNRKSPYAKFVWSEQHTWLLAKAKHLTVYFGEGLITHLHELLSGRCIRLVISDHQASTIPKLASNEIIRYLFHPVQSSKSSREAKHVNICTKCPFDEEQGRHFLEAIKQKFMDALVAIDFSFRWHIEQEGFEYWGFTLNNERIQRKLNFESYARNFHIQTKVYEK